MSEAKGYKIMYIQSELVRSGESVGCAAGLTWPSHTEVWHKTEVLKDILNLQSDGMNGT